MIIMDHEKLRKVIEAGEAIITGVGSVICTVATAKNGDFIAAPVRNDESFKQFENDFLMEDERKELHKLKEKFGKLPKKHSLWEN